MTEAYVKTVAEARASVTESITKLRPAIAKILPIRLD